MPTTLLSKFTAGATVLAACTAVAACRTARTSDPMADKCVTSVGLVEGAPASVVTQGGGCKSPTRAAAFPAVALQGRRAGHNGANRHGREQ